MLRPTPFVALLAATVVAGGCGGPRKTAPPTSAQAHERTPSAKPTPRPRPALPPHLAPISAGVLPAAVQDAAAAPWPGGAVLVGGLTAADVSTDEIVVVNRAGARVVGRLPGAFHDAAAARLGRLVYAFGGGNGVAQLDQILRIDPRTGAAERVGSLPAPSSDQAAASLNGTAYVVGGYTGARWLDTIVAWRPGARARVVAHLPVPLRYAAVTAAGGRIVIAGGSLESGAASSVVYAYTPGARRVVTVAHLPAPTTHAAAAALGTTVFVIGGRGATPGTPSGRVLAVVGRHTVPVGTLRSPLSDAAAVATGTGILVAGGSTPSGTTGALSLLDRAVRHTAHVTNVYAADRVGYLSAAVRSAKPYVYVPNSDSNTVDVIDQRTFRVVRHFAVGALPQHVVPAWNLRTLYVTNDASNSVTPIDPTTAAPGKTIHVDDPYNMYFTPDGRYAIVVAERLHRLDFRNATTFALHRSVDVPCAGVDHMDFTADGRYAIVSCEFSGQLLEVDVQHERVADVLTLRAGAAPQDVKLSPDGRVFYVADMNANGVWIVDARRFRVLRFMHTGAGAHGLYPSRDARYLYVTNRMAGTISVVSFRTRRIVHTWAIPGGSPDMGNVDAGGKVLWLTGRYNAEVYAISTKNGRLLARIHVGAGPHGLCVWPQPGRYSLGHTGILR